MLILRVIGEKVDSLTTSRFFELQHVLATIQNSAREKLPIVEVMNEVSSVATFSFLRLVMSMENHFPLGIVKQ